MREIELVVYVERENKTSYDSRSTRVFPLSGDTTKRRIIMLRSRSLSVKQSDPLHAQRKPLIPNVHHFSLFVSTTRNRAFFPAIVVFFPSTHSKSNAFRPCLTQNQRDAVVWWDITKVNTRPRIICISMERHR